MKKIAIVTSGSLPIPATKGGGVETLTEILLDENEKSHDFDFTVFTIYDELAIDKQKEYKFSQFVNIKENPRKKRIITKLNTYIYALNRRTFKIPKLKLQNPFCKYILRNGRLNEFDAVLVESNFDIVARLKKAGVKKIIYHAHYNDVNPNISAFEKVRYNYGYRFIDTNISVSKFIENNIKSVINKDLEYFVAENCTKKIDLIDNGEKVILANKFSIPTDKTVIMYSGRVTPEKGITQLLNAFKNLNHLKDICLVVAGGAFYSDNNENDYVKRLKAIARECENPVIFTGYVEHSEMLKLWQLADFAVLPTYDVEEAAGLVVIEAMSAGVPVIHTDSGGMSQYTSPEYAVEIKRGDDFENRLASEMEKLCLSPENCKKMGEIALKNSEKWSTENYYIKCKTSLDNI